MFFLSNGDRRTASIAINPVHYTVNYFSRKFNHPILLSKWNSLVHVISGEKSK